MVRSVRNLQKFEIAATDGPIGSVADVLFDDERWIVRYLVVETGNWLPGRRVLISPLSVVQTEWDAQRLVLSITRNQVEHSPAVDTHKPVSRQHEVDHLNYYGYPHYWTSPEVWAPAPLSAEVQQEEAEADVSPADRHLRSAGEVFGYAIRATDGELGHADDLLIEDVSWAVRYLVVDTSNWWFGRHVLIAPEWITDINWPGRHVAVDLTRQAVKEAPPYDRAGHTNRQWEAAYYERLGRPGYWLTANQARRIKRAQEYLREEGGSLPPS
ncbi:MAG: PRC-barrel domain containing protein [Vicinamibacterales bacterium]